MSKQDLKPLYQKYSGNRESDKLQVFKIDTKFRFIYQQYTRTNPSQAERAKGFKQTRIQTSEKIFEFDSIENVDFKGYPFYHLLTDFNPDTA